MIVLYLRAQIRDYTFTNQLWSLGNKQIKEFSQISVLTMSPGVRRLQMVLKEARGLYFLLFLHFRIS